MLKVIPQYNGFLHWLSFTIAAALDDRVKVALEVVKRVLPLATLYSPGWLLYALPVTNIGMTYFTTDSKWSKGLTCARSGLEGAISLGLGSDSSLRVHSCFNIFTNLYATKNSFQAGNRLDMADNVVKVLGNCLYFLAPNSIYPENVEDEEKNLVPNALLCQSISHIFQLVRVAPNVPKWGTPLTFAHGLLGLEVVVQTAMAGIRLYQAWQVRRPSNIHYEKVV
jgi:hypothetical protein